MLWLNPWSPSLGQEGKSCQNDCAQQGLHQGGQGLATLTRGWGAASIQQTPPTQLPSPDTGVPVSGHFPLPSPATGVPVSGHFPSSITCCRGTCLRSFSPVTASTPTQELTGGVSHQHPLKATWANGPQTVSTAWFQHLARGFWLSPEPTFGREPAECPGSLGYEATQNKTKCQNQTQTLGTEKDHRTWRQKSIHIHTPLSQGKTNQIF